MKLLFVSDSFKGSLSSEDTVRLLTEAAHEVFGECETVGLPVADGGEGTVDAVVKALGGEKIYNLVTGPLGEKVEAYYGAAGSMAVIEMAQASGLPLVPEGKRNPLYTSTYGTGELILDALKRGYREIRIAIGGSATNDGGMGAMEALGARFLDSAGNELSGTGENLEKVESIDMSGFTPLAGKADIKVMCDVTNPLCGKDGATRTFGKQKGGTPEILERLEAGMLHYRDVLIREFGRNADDMPGTGAAGGLGAALLIFLNAKMESGIECVLDMINFDSLLCGTDLVVTGEGRTDWQSCFGKVMQGIGDRCRAKGIPAVGICGSLGPGYEDIYGHGICSIITTVDGPMSLEEALKNAEKLYRQAAVRTFRMLKAGTML